MICRSSTRCAKTCASGARLGTRAHTEIVTRDLLSATGPEQGRARRLFFCQIEAVETIVYLQGDPVCREGWHSGQSQAEQRGPEPAAGREIARHSAIRARTCFTAS